ncbi:MAG: hypothetical protein LBL55_09730, partial [Propionibacteriaceae bacterium]|nr:hypothetical protein [Propionibacteriaceae bacterium]
MAASTLTPDNTHSPGRVQDDLYRHVNGRWLAEQTIPPDKPATGVFERLREASQAAGRQICQELAQGGAVAPGAGPAPAGPALGAGAEEPTGPAELNPDQAPAAPASGGAEGPAVRAEEASLGQLWRDFMDQAEVESLGAQPLADWLARIDRMADLDDLRRWLGWSAGAGLSSLIAFEVEADPGQPSRHLLFVAQDGLGLPDESYYHQPEHEPVRQAYRRYLARALELAGVDRTGAPSPSTDPDQAVTNDPDSPTDREQTGAQAVTDDPSSTAGPDQAVSNNPNPPTSHDRGTEGGEALAVTGDPHSSWTGADRVVTDGPSPTAGPGQAVLNNPNPSTGRERTAAPAVSNDSDPSTQQSRLEERVEAVWRLECAIAACHWDIVRTRDLTEMYNLRSRAELSQAAPALGWETILSQAGVDPAVVELVDCQPSFFTEVAALLRPERLAAWRDWARVRLVTDLAPFLSDDFVQARFEFYGRALMGTPELKPRWKRALDLVEGAMGQALGRLYVERHFQASAKAQVQDLVSHLLAAYRQSISQLDWMSPATKREAGAKLDGFRAKIGYPERWRDYSGLRLVAGDLVGNVIRAGQHETAYQLGLLTKPVDPDEWLMTPQTVNA